MAYDSSKLILGDNLFLYHKVVSGTSISYEPLAYSTECSLSFSQDTIDTSNKMSGVWSSALPGKLSWEISTNCLYSKDAYGFDDFYDAMVSRKGLYVVFGYTEDTNSSLSGTDAEDADFTLDETHTYYAGTCYITSCELSAGNGEVGTISLSLTGDGKLEKNPTLPTTTA